MSKLIEELKRDHSAIADMLNKVKEFGISSKDAQNTLLSAKTSLLAHLRKEDNELYPALRKAAESDSNLKGTLDMFAKDMETISKAAFEFFDKYSQGGSGLEFAKDFGRLFATLKSRIQKEEDILYARYDKLSQ